MHLKTRALPLLVAAMFISSSACVSHLANSDTTPDLLRSDIISNSPAPAAYQDERFDDETRLVSIDQNDFEKKLESKSSFWIYIGRPNCPDCQEYHPRLAKHLEDNDIDILYFNTRVKTSQKASMVTFLDSLGVDEIPAIIHVEDGCVLRVYDMQTEQDINDFENEYKKESEN